MAFLYRGVNKVMDASNAGLIRPAGSSMYAEFTADTTKITADSTHFTIGLTLDNTARAQQIEGGLFDAAGVSTTRCLNQAVKFATFGGFEDGFVYVLNEAKLEELGVVMKEFIDPEHPHEHEVTLLIPDLQPVPEEAIVEKIEILDGRPTRPIPVD